MKYFASLLLLLLSFHSNAQTLKGQIIDESTKLGISNANIKILNSDKFTQSDESGFFKIEKMNVGRYSIEVKSTGFEKAIVNEVLLSVGKETDLIIQLTENVNELNEVIIKVQKEYGNVQNEMATISAKSISVEQTKRYAATWGDPARMALSFSGTSNVNDQTNEIVIRGNSPKGMLWKIEGIEVPNPSHFSTEGASGGGLSALSTNVLGNSDFYTGAFPAEYGNATSGVFDVRLRKGNSDKRETTVQAGFQGLEIGTEGPFSKQSKSSYLINYRYSTLGIMDKIGISPISTANPTFQDLTFKVSFPHKKNSISIWGIGGLSNSNYKKEGYIEESNFLASGLNSVIYIDKKTYLENIVSFSGSGILNGSTQKEYGFGDTKSTRYSNIRFSSQLNQKISAKHQLRTGVIASFLRFNLLNKIEFDSLPGIGRFVDTKLDDKGNSSYLQGFFQWKYRFNSNFTLNSGLHSTYFILNKTYSVEPRIGLKYQINVKGSVNFGFGVHSRLEPLSIYLSRVTIQNNGILTNQSLLMPKSLHLILGYEVRPNKNWRINTEGYLQKNSQMGVAQYDFLFKNFSLTNEIDVDMLNIPLLESTGLGQNFGIELTLERFLVDGFYLLGTTSIYKSTFTNLGGENFIARFSNNFVQNILAGKEWKVGKENKNIFSLNIRSTYAGGIRVVPIDLEKSNQMGYEIRDYENIYNQQQLDDFFRTDFKINFIKNAKRITSTFSLDLNNITNHKNPKRLYYDYASKSTAILYQLGFLPVFNYRLEF